MKKKITAFTALLVVLVLLAGCAKSSERPFNYDLSKYITLGKYVGIEYTYSVEDVTAEAVEKFINAELKEKGYGEEKEITNRAVENGDIVNIDFEGKLNGEAFEGGSSKGHDLTIGSGTFIEGFEDGLVGAKIGETRDLNLKFPEDYGKEELNGKAVVFTVTVNSIKATVYPEITDEILKELGDYANIEAYNDYAKAQVKENNEQTAKNKKESEIWSKIVNDVKVIELPQKEIDNYKELLLESYEQTAQNNYGMSYEELLKQLNNQTLEDIDPQLTEQAQQATKEYMTIVAIARDQGLDLTEEEYQEQADTYAKSSGYPTTEEFLEAIDQGQFYLSLLIERVMDFVVENAVEVK